MQGFVNREALLTNISSRKATFYSRSRSTLWTKGETSMNFINVCDVFLDCDCDSVSGTSSLVVVSKLNSICRNDCLMHLPDNLSWETRRTNLSHRAETCYFTSVNDVINDPKVDDNRPALTTLYSLESTISKRKELSEIPDAKPSWTKRLLLDDNLLCSKIREEADELCRTLEESEGRLRTAS